MQKIKSVKPPHHGPLQTPASALERRHRIRPQSGTSPLVFCHCLFRVIRPIRGNPCFVFIANVREVREVRG